MKERIKVREGAGEETNPHPLKQRQKIMYSYAIIRTEKSMLNYCQKRWKETPAFVGDFAHIGGVVIERIYEKTPQDAYYVPYYLMIAEDANGTFGDVCNIRDKVYEDLRTGKAALVKGF